MRSTISIIALSAVFILVTGCSAGNPYQNSDPVNPNPVTASMDEMPGTYLWGLFEIAIDADTGTAEVVRLRGASAELNVLGFLEGEGTFLTITDLQLNLPLVDATVRIKHPFTGLGQFTGFMVRGVVLSDGTWAGFADPNLVMSAPDELRLINADGYTRWMNPVEFPFDGTINNYTPGEMGDPNGGSYGSTINPYKLFANGLEEIADDLELNISTKAMFGAGELISRRYKLDFGAQPLKFQYAVVASWDMPLNIPPQIPDDFPLGTVASEPWKIEVNELSNHLWYADEEFGVDLSLQIIVRDFENADQDVLFIEAPGAFPRQEMTLVSQSGIDVTFELDVQDITLTSADPFEVLIEAIAMDDPGYGGALPDEFATMYHIYSVDVFIEPQTVPLWPFHDPFDSWPPFEWTPFGGEWWGKSGGYMDAKGGGTCYEEDTGSDQHNPNVSYVQSPLIPIPGSPGVGQDVIITINHRIDVDPCSWLGNWWWDICYLQVNGEKVHPETGTPYKHCHDPWSLPGVDNWGWEGFHEDMESTFNLGNQYNGTSITVEFVLDTFDYILNCDPPYEGWMIDDISIDFAQ